MALLPTIPTSFVPHNAAAPADRRSGTSDLGSVFSFLAYAVLAIVLIGALGVFFYGRVLAMDLSAKDAALVSAEKSIDPTTVSSFVQLHDRLQASETLLGSHIALSGFLAAFGSIVPGTVRFSSLHVTVDTTGATTVNGIGVAKSFNALAVASEAFATDGRIKNVIFSNMSINKDNSISFGFSALLDPSLTAFTPAPALVQQNTTPAAAAASSTTP
jgi:Fe-S-cluster formation regulator IscX/YfhJ